MQGITAAEGLVCSVVDRCRPAAGGHVAAAVPPGPPSQSSGSLGPGLCPVLPGAHLFRQPSESAPPILGTTDAFPFMGRVRPMRDLLCNYFMGGPLAFNQLLCVKDRNSSFLYIVSLLGIVGPGAE